MITANKMFRIKSIKKIITVLSFKFKYSEKRHNVLFFPEKSPIRINLNLKIFSIVPITEKNDALDIFLCHHPTYPIESH